jgi:hypothetical protein
MLDLERLWRDAPADTKACTLTGSTKNMVLNAITEGARTFEDVKKAVQLCENNDCAKINPSKRGCVENVKALLEIYVPVFDMMQGAGGCLKQSGKSYDPPKFEKGPACEGCTGCDGDA